MSTSRDRACLVIVANVPIQLLISLPLAMSLPQACNIGSVPLQRTPFQPKHILKNYLNCSSVCHPSQILDGPAILLPPPPPTASAPLSPGGNADAPLSPVPSASSPSSPGGGAACSRPRHGSKAVSLASLPQIALALTPAKVEAPAPRKAQVQEEREGINPIMSATAMLQSRITLPFSLIILVAAFFYKLY